MTPLARAREAGLDVSLDLTGDLVVRGPKRLAPLAADVLAHADEVRAELEAGIARPQAPADACLGCGTSAWWRCPDWPEPGRGAWLCRTCCARAVGTSAERLRAAWDGLTAADRARLEAEATAGDPLARSVIDAVAEARPRRGGEVDRAASVVPVDALPDRLPDDVPPPQRKGAQRS